MKPLLAIVLVSLAGCQVPPIPKDAAIIGNINVNANALSGTATVKGAMLTGKAVTPDNVKAAVESVGEAIK